MADFPLPRLRVNPGLRAAVRASGRAWQIASATGFRHYSRFSATINAESIPASTINIERLQRVADAVAFPRDHIFLDGGR